MYRRKQPASYTYTILALLVILATLSWTYVKPSVTAINFPDLETSVTSN